MAAAACPPRAESSSSSSSVNGPSPRLLSACKTPTTSPSNERIGTQRMLLVR